MKNKYGLILNKLILSNGTETREVNFYKGLNFIYGPTDTGKTYIYQLIKYLLGSNDKPKDIPENNDFINVFLEITSNFTGKTFTLNRVIGTNKIYVYESSFDNINNSTHSNPFNTNGRSKIISKELMQHAGLETEYQIKKKINEEEYQNINFRNYLYFSMVDEVSIIKDKSPLITGQFVSKTFELNLFYYLVSNTSFDYLTHLSLKKKETQKKNLKGKKTKENPINYIVIKTQKEISELEEQLNNSDEISYSDEIIFITNEINSKSEELHILFKNSEKIKSKILMNNELVKRFKLLKEQFVSDMERLEFILEGGDIISNLRIETCTICGNQLNKKNHSHSNIFEVNHIDGKALYNSYTSEKNKIILNLKDLEETIDIILTENQNLNDQLSINENLYKNINNQINNELKPTKKSIEKKMDKMVEKKLINQKILFLKNIVKELQTDNKNIEANNPLIKDSQKSNYDKVSSSINELCTLMSNYLDEMRWKQDTTATEVYFDFHEHDFVIDGKSRSIYGKGYRAIIYSVFLISFMQHSRLNAFPHIGFVLLDSPLTTYQEGDEINEEDIIPDDLKQRFIRTFSEEREDQIIVLDNQFKLDTTINKFNCIKFTKKHDEGRYGFM